MNDSIEFRYEQARHIDKHLNRNLIRRYDSRIAQAANISDLNHIVGLFSTELFGHHHSIISCVFPRRDLRPMMITPVTEKQILGLMLDLGHSTGMSHRHIPPDIPFLFTNSEREFMHIDRDRAASTSQPPYSGIYFRHTMATGMNYVYGWHHSDLVIEQKTVVQYQSAIKYIICGIAERAQYFRNMPEFGNDDKYADMSRRLISCLEYKAIRAVADGYSREQIASIHNIKPKELDGILEKMRNTFEAKNTTHLVACLYRSRLLA